MAEVTGQIGDQYVELNNAATEATLKDLVRAVTLLARVKGKESAEAEKELEKLYNSSKKLNPELLKQAQQQKKSTANQKEADKATVADTRTRRDSTKATEEETKAKSSAIDKLKAFGLGLERTLSSAINITSSLANAGDSMSSATQIFSHIPFVGGVLSGALGAVAQAAEKTHNALVQAASVGATFGGSMTNMINTASQAGLTFEQFSGLIAKNGPALALLGQGTEDGAKEFAKMSKTMRTMVTNELANLGYTTESANQHMLQYTGRLAKLGIAQRMSTDQLTAASKNYLVNLDALSKLTGKSKEALEAEQDRLDADSAIRFASAQMMQIDPKAAEAFRDTLIAAGPVLGAGMGEFITTGAARTPEAQAIANFMPGLQAALDKARAEYLETGKVSEETSLAIQKISQDESKRLMSDKELSYQLSTLNKEQYGSFMQGVMDLAARQTDLETTRGQSTAGAAAGPTEAGAREANRQKVAELSNQINQELVRMLPAVTAALDGLKDGVTNILSPLLSSLSSNIDTVVTIMKGVIVAAVALKGALLFKSLKEGLGFGKGGRGAPGAPDVDKSRGKTPGTDRGAGKGPGGAPAESGGSAGGGKGLLGNLKGGLKGLGIGAVLGVGGSLAADALGRDTRAGATADTLGTTASFAGTGALIGSIIPGVGTAIGGVIGGLVGATVGIYENGTTMFEGLGTQMSSIWTGTKDTVASWGDSIKTGITDLKTYGSSMWASTKQTVSDWGTSISQGFTDAKTQIASVWTGTKETIASWGTSISQGFTDAKTQISSVWSGAKESIASWGDSIKTGFASLASSASTIFSNAKNIAGNMVATAKDAVVSNIPSSIKEMASSAANKVSETVASAKAALTKTETAASAKKEDLTKPTEIAAGKGQISVETLVMNLNNKLDQMITLNTRLAEIAERQLAVQKGFNGDLMASV